MTSPATQATRVDRALDELESIGLDELNLRAELMTRVDRKYVLAAHALPAVLADLPPRTRALEFDGPDRTRSSAYASVYFDTPELVAFHLAARSRRRRFKVRTRTYLDAELSFLEVKTRGGRSLTVKDRLEVDPAAGDRLTADGRAYAELVLDHAGVPAPDTGALVATLTTRYRRSTLLLPASAAGDESRATIDQDLEWIDEGARGAFGRALRLPGTVIVETKSGSRAGDLDRALWRHGHRPDSISKFGTGLAALRPELPQNKWTRVLRRHFDHGAERAAP
ncbi:polyphosphate polymerase domain-containing protein [Agromyces sp. NPDC004153]